MSCNPGNACTLFDSRGQIAQVVSLLLQSSRTVPKQESVRQLQSNEKLRKWLQPCQQRSKELLQLCAEFFIYKKSAKNQRQYSQSRIFPKKVGLG